MILRKLLGEIMAEMGFVTREQVREALRIQRKKIEEKTLPECLDRPCLVSQARLIGSSSSFLGPILTDLGFASKEQTNIY